MPKYNFTCKSCGEGSVRIMKACDTKKPQPACGACGGAMKRAASPPTTQTLERLDNGFMTKPVERLKEIPRLAHEHAKGKKSAI